MKRLKFKIIATMILIIFLLSLISPITIAVETLENKETTTVDIEKNGDENTEVEYDSKEESTPEIDTNKEKEQEKDNIIGEKNVENEKGNNDDEKIDENKIMPISSAIQIESGKIYRIKAGVGTNKYLDIAEASSANSANLQLWTLNKSSDQQKFKVTKKGEYYEIQPCHTTGKLLDVAGAGKTNGTNVAQYKSNGTDAQKWILQNAGNGWFYVIPKCSSGMALDVASAGTQNGTNVQIYKSNKTNAQKFKFEEVKPMESKRELAKDGIYKIKPKSGGSLDIAEASSANSANLQIWSSSNENQQKFNVTWKNGYYEIAPAHTTGKLLDVAGAGKTNGTNVAQYQSNETDAQKWILKSAGDGYYYIISKCSELYLDVAGGLPNNGTNVQTYTGNGTNAQKFKFEETSVIKGTIANGTYRITTGLAYDNAHYKNMALDIAEGSKGAGANLQIWGNTNSLQQRFKLTLIDNNYYIIEPAHASGMALQVSGTNVIQAKKNINSASQLWTIERLGNNFYTIKSKSTGLYLDVSGAGLIDGTNVGVYKKNNTSAQKWKIEEVYYGIDVSYLQGDINVNALINSKEADFAIMRLGFSEDNENGGRKITETNLLNNVNLPGERINYGKLKGRIPLGAYIYTYADTVEDAKNDAYAVVNLIKSTGMKFELPIFFDIEDKKQATINPVTRTTMCKEFCRILYENGLKPGIYSNLEKLNTWINMDQIPSYVSIWASSYGKYNDSYVPGEKYKYAKNHDIWQYCSTGSIDGISGIVDVNITFKKMW